MRSVFCDGAFFIDFSFEIVYLLNECSQDAMHLITQKGVPIMERHIVELDHKDLAEKAIELVLPSIQGAMSSGLFKRQHMHLIILDGRIPYEGQTVEEMVQQAVLAEFSIGEDDWEHNYKDIARSKVHMTWKTGKPSDQVPHHMRQDGDTIYSGSAIVDSTIAGGSGVQWYFDRMAGTWLASGYNALVHNACEQAENDFINK